MLSIADFEGDIGSYFKLRELQYRPVLKNSYSETPDWHALRVDGRSFHTYTRSIKAEKPFDPAVSIAMRRTMLDLCYEIQGARIGYTQSDEISIVFSSGTKDVSELWFGGKAPKVISIGASMATAYFNKYLRMYKTGLSWINTEALAHFDCRVLSFESEQEALSYLWWRFLDAKKNAVSSIAHSLFGAKAIEGVKHRDRKAMIVAELGEEIQDEYDLSDLVGTVAVKTKPVDPLTVSDGALQAHPDTRAETPAWELSHAPDFARYNNIPMHEELTEDSFTLP